MSRSMRRHHARFTFASSGLVSMDVVNTPASRTWRLQVENAWAAPARDTIRDAKCRQRVRVTRVLRPPLRAMPQAEARFGVITDSIDPRVVGSSPTGPTL